jgi:hypothetical protein
MSDDTEQEEGFELRISGFKSKAEVEVFIDWYCGQGEQDASIWFDCRMDEGKIDRSSMNADCQATYPIQFNGNTALMKLHN